MIEANEAVMPLFHRDKRLERSYLQLLYNAESCGWDTDGRAQEASRSPAEVHHSLDLVVHRIRLDLHTVEVVDHSLDSVLQTAEAGLAVELHTVEVGCILGSGHHTAVGVAQSFVAALQIVEAVDHSLDFAHSLGFGLHTVVVVGHKVGLHSLAVHTCPELTFPVNP